MNDGMNPVLVSVPVATGASNDLSELGRALAAARRRVVGECVICGQPVEGVTRGGKQARLYCSYRCKKAAYRSRKHAAQLNGEDSTATPNINTSHD